MAADYLHLIDWKRRTGDLYGTVRRSSDVRDAWAVWRRSRDEMFASHPQSPVPRGERLRFPGLRYFDYDPRARVLADLEDAECVAHDIAASGGETVRCIRFGIARFRFGNLPAALELYWLEGYGGGIFLPFRDATSGGETSGAGRYLLDSVKGADLGVEEGRLVLDFNFAYHPSCVYDPRWICPLPPPGNRLGFPIRAGERLPAAPA